jgi:hypothetical protein
MASAILVGLIGLGICVLLAAFRLADRRDDDSEAAELLAVRCEELAAENQRLRAENLTLSSANQRLAAGIWHPSLRRSK